MPFLEDAWYVGCMSGELADRPLARMILGRKLVFFRGGNGVPAALEDRCPHRFVRLSSGKVVGDALQCPYHGLRYDAGGTCVHQPFEEGAPAPHNRVRSYPVMERFGYVWLWTGDPAAADPALLPDYGILVDPSQKTVYGYLHVRGNYQLIADNVLDLTHVDYIHPDARTAEGYNHFVKKIEQVGDRVTMWLWKPNATPNRFQHDLWGSTDAKGDLFSHMEWNAPGHLLLRNGIQSAGAPEGSELYTPGAHLLTPETETTTHYFWTVGRNVRLDDAELDARILKMLTHVFSTQDCPMIAQQQEAMGDDTDVMAQHPVILSTDCAAVRARRILQKRIRAERQRRAGAAVPASPAPLPEPA